MENGVPSLIKDRLVPHLREVLLHPFDLAQLSTFVYFNKQLSWLIESLIGTGLA